MAVTWTSKWRWHTGYSADSVEWCPVVPHTDLLVCGTYQLDKKDDELIGAKQKRMGRIYLFQINQGTSDITAVQTIDTSGILDQKWCYHTIQGHPVLGTVTSDGYIQLYRLLESDGKINLKMWVENPISENILALSLDWSTNKHHSDEPHLVVSDSTGGVTLWRIAGDTLQKIGDWKAHGFEAWITAFNYWNPDVFYSGGDDCVFKSFDRRLPDAVSTNRSHEAGVTAIRCHVGIEHQLLTGSYDEKVRLWDTRTLKRCITETDVNGGVWRLKWHPYNDTTILAACMYGGFRILKNEGDISVACEYLEHESMAYGADWKFCDDRLSVVATCSFYDCKMHVSEVDLGE